MNDRDALLAAIEAAPGDDAPRLIFADWLEEHGEPVVAAWIRRELAGPRGAVRLFPLVSDQLIDLDPDCPAHVGYIAEWPQDDSPALPIHAWAEGMRLAPLAFCGLMMREATLSYIDPRSRSAVLTVRYRGALPT